MELEAKQAALRAEDAKRREEALDAKLSVPNPNAEEERFADLMLMRFSQTRLNFFCRRRKQEELDRERERFRQQEQARYDAEQVYCILI